MKKKYVLVKGRYGMGGRINVLLGAWDYALRTKRTLVVDWSDGYYGSLLDTFQRFFDNDFLILSDLRDGFCNNTLTVFPQAWQGVAFESGFQSVHQNLYQIPPPQKDVLEDVVVVTWVSNEISNERLTYLCSLLKPKAGIVERIDRLMAYSSWNGLIGIHYRHGNGEKGVVCPDPKWFVERVLECDPGSQSNILLCTDAASAQDFFLSQYGERLIVLDKLFPENGPLHNNKLIIDKHSNGQDALADLYALARCDFLIDSGEFFGKTAWLLGSGKKLGRFTYPGRTRLFNSQVSDLMSSDMFPIAADSYLSGIFAENIIKIDNMYFQRNTQGYRIFYGVDFVFDLPLVIGVGDVALLICAIKSRRLYL